MKLVAFIGGSGNKGNDNNSVDISNKEIIKRFCKNVKLKTNFDNYKALFSNKIKKISVFKENIIGENIFRSRV